MPIARLLAGKCQFPKRRHQRKQKAKLQMNDTNKEAGNDAYEGPLSPAGVAALKFAVVGMGVLIIVGLLVIVGRLIYLAAKPKSVTQPTKSSAYAREATALLPATAKPVRTSTDGSQLSILYETANNKFGVLIVDLRTGETVSNVRIRAKP